jgi:hypothetical protein
MDPRLVAAVETSRRWYDAVCAVHEVPVWCDDHLWVALAAMPAYHSTVKTLSPGVGRDAVLAAMERHPAGGGVADSFGTLDLAPDGYALLFDATWLHHEGFSDAVWPEGWSIVRDAALLAAWAGAHDYLEVLVPAVLDHGDFRILARLADGVPVAGAVIHDAGPVVGLSNVWSSVRPVTSSDHADLLACAAVLQSGRPVTAYAWGDELDAMLDAGYQPLGPQRVWARTQPSGP